VCLSQRWPSASGKNQSCGMNQSGSLDRLPNLTRIIYSPADSDGLNQSCGALVKSFAPVESGLLVDSDGVNHSCGEGVAWISPGLPSLPEPESVPCQAYCLDHDLTQAAWWFDWSNPCLVALSTSMHLKSNDNQPPQSFWTVVIRANTTCCRDPANQISKHSTCTN
jgi:hypothetical protein